MRLLFIIALVFLVNLTTLAQASEYNLKSISSEDYAKLVDDACQKPAKPFWSSTMTVEMLKGNDIYLICLKKHIQMMMKDYFSKKSKFNNKKAEKLIENITNNYQELYNNLYEERKSCYTQNHNGCLFGSIHRVVASAITSEIYLLIVSDIASGIREGGSFLPPPPVE